MCCGVRGNGGPEERSTPPAAWHSTQHLFRAGALSWLLVKMTSPFFFPQELQVLVAASSASQTFSSVQDLQHLSFSSGWRWGQSLSWSSLATTVLLKLESGSPLAQPAQTVILGGTSAMDEMRMTCPPSESLSDCLSQRRGDREGDDLELAALLVEAVGRAGARDRGPHEGQLGLERE